MKKQPKVRMARRGIAGSLVLAVLFVVAFSAAAFAQNVEWAVVPGGGGDGSTGGGNTLNGTVSQFANGDSAGATGFSTGGGNYEKPGYRIAIPQKPDADCTVGGIACDTAACYGTSDSPFHFANAAGCAASPCAFDAGATQYYRYLWQTSATYTHAGIQAGSSWGDTNALCPGGSCTKLGTNFDSPATSSSDYYLIIRSINGGQTAPAEGLIGGDSVMGPYQYDMSPPTIAGAPIATSTYYAGGAGYVDGTFDLSVSGIADVGCGGITYCYYSKDNGGTWATATYSAGSCSQNAITCADGLAMNLKMRARDGKDNYTASTALPATCDTGLPTVTFNGPANNSWQGADFTINVTDTDARSGLALCQYQVQSYDGAGWVVTRDFTSRTCNNATSATVTVGAASDCRNMSVLGSNVCRVYVRATDNVGNVRTQNNTFKIDWTPPSVCVPTVTETTSLACQYVTGTTLYYNNNASCGGGTGQYDVSATSADADSGILRLNFPSTTSNGANDASSPYGLGYMYSATSTYSAVATITAYNNASLTSTCTVDILRDITGPTGGALSYTDGYATTTALTVTYGAVSDAGSGLASYVMQYQSATLTDGSCGAYGSWTNTTNQPGSAAAGSIAFTATDGNCYQFQYVLTDNVSNVTNVTSTAVTKVDSTPPGPCSISGISEDTSAACQYVSGSTVYYNNNAACSAGTGQHTVTATATDTQSGILQMVFPTTVSAGATDSATPFANQYTYDSSDTYNTAGTITVYNPAYMSNTCTFNTTRDIAVPTGGVLTYTNGYQSSLTIAVGYTAAVDVGSGVGTNVLQYQTATLTGGVCGGYGAWGDTPTQPSGSGAGSVNFTAVDGNCYKFQYVLTDNVSNSTTVTSAFVTKVVTSPPTAGTVTPTNVSYTSGPTSWVDGNFDVNTTFTDNNSGVASCQYYCSNGTGNCDGTWRGGTWSAGTCSTTGLTCADGANLSINMRATNNAGLTGTGTAVIRICDPVAPVTTDNWTDNWTNVTPTNITLTPTDARSGVKGTYYCVDTLNTCSPNTSGTAVSVPCGSSSCVQYARYLSLDNVDNYEATASKRVRYDGVAPNNPASVTGYDSSGMGTTLVSGDAYEYTGPTGPYFTWTAPTDNPVGTNSGVSRYYVYFGTDTAATPVTANAAANYTNTATLVGGATYVLRIRTEDNAGNISSPVTLFTYRYSVGGYLRVTFDETNGYNCGGLTGSQDDPDGILAPASTYEILTVTMYDDWDNVATHTTKAVTMSLSGATGSGAKFNSGGYWGGSPTWGGTSVTGTLTNGSACVNVQATAAASDTLWVTASASGLSHNSGRDQSAPVLVRTDVSGSGTLISNVTLPVPAPLSQLVMNPAWSHGGDKIAYIGKPSSSPCANCEGWNVYVTSYSGGAWGAPVRLTNDNFAVRQNSRLAWTASGAEKDQYVILNVKQGSETYLLAVKTDGSDAGSTYAALAATRKLSYSASPTAIRRWYDPDWSNSSCAQYGDQLIAGSRSDGVGAVYSVLRRMSGTKNALGLYDVSSSTVDKLIDIPSILAILSPRWSNDCTKIVFTAWDGNSDITVSKVGVYVLDMPGSGTFGAAVTSLADARIRKVYECAAAPGTCADGAAFLPSFSADDLMVSYSVDKTKTANFTVLSSALDDLVGTFYSGHNFDNYLQYLPALPTQVRQMVGEGPNNEFAMAQCTGGLGADGAGCPNSTDGKPFTYITQSSSTTGNLRLLTLGTESAIKASGGLLFYHGAVAVVFPPGAVGGLSDETVFSVATPAISVSQDGKDMLVSTGVGRNFFPDGAKFDGSVLLVFKYCDSDNDGFLDTNQDATCTGGGNTAFDVNKMFVYYYCDTTSSLGCTSGDWMKLDGTVDTVSKTLTVATNHFSTYDVFALMRGMSAPNTFREVRFDESTVPFHTYPNPWRSGDPNVCFNVGAVEWSAGRNLEVGIDIYDLRGRQVKTLRRSSAVLATGPAAGGGTMDIACWDVRNNSGSPVASGVYLYRLSACDGITCDSRVGKLSVLR